MGVQAGQPPAMDPPRPRLCHLRKWANFQGYGFNLHTDKSKESQLVGNVDPESPADAAGVKRGDRIIEVNGTNISNENHTQVVARIKAGGEETRILVADKECFDWHRERGQNISSSLSYVLHLSSERPASPAPSSSSSSSSSASEEESAPVESPPAPVQPIVEEDEGVEIEEEETRPTSPPPAPAPAPAPAPVKHPSSSSSSESETDEEVATPSPAASPAMRAPPAGKEASSSDSEPEQKNPGRRKESTSSSEEEEVKPRSFGTQASKTSVTSTGSRFSYKKDELVAGLQLNMTAAEMRARVSRNKKPDPRREKIDLKQKAAIIRNM